MRINSYDHKMWAIKGFASFDTNIKILSYKNICHEESSNDSWWDKSY